MKIAYLVNSYPLPSQSFIRREIQAIERRGVDVHRFAMRGDRAALVDAGDIAEHEKTEHLLDLGASRLLSLAVRQMLRAPSNALSGLRLAIASGRLSEQGIVRHMIYFVEACAVARRCEMLGIDHVHAHFGTNSATVAMLARCLGGPSYSFTVHGPEEFDRPVTLGLREKMHRAAFTVAVSSYGRSQLSRWAEYGDWDRIEVVHCGIEPARFGEIQPLPTSGTRLVAIGRLVEQKGQLLLVQAMARATRTHPDLHLTLVGDGEMRREIESVISAFRLEKNITLIGWVDEARVRAELAAAHALVMPSFAEGLPMVVMEAMAAGRPVIATYIAGLPELVREGENGWLVPAGDMEALVGAIGVLAETSADGLRAMGRAARAAVLRRHDIDIEAARLLALFTSACSTAPRVARRATRPPEPEAMATKITDSTHGI